MTQEPDEPIEAIDRSADRGKTKALRETDAFGETDVLEVAAAAAGQAYRDLAVYTVAVTRQDDGWHVDYDLTDPEALGGGPHFVIDPASGEITAQRFDQ